MPRGFLSFLALLTFQACAAQESLQPSAAYREAVVYDADDRREVYNATRPELRTLAERSVAAMILRGAVDLADPGHVKISGLTLARAKLRANGVPLCASVPFQQQPTAASCSATLIDDDLVLTAGHCLRSEAHCAKARFVFDYHYTAPSVRANVGIDDVYSCRRIVAWDPSLDQEAPDVAIVQLDRPVVSRQPVRLSLVPVVVDEPVVMIGFPDGLPAKVDHGGRVLETKGSNGFIMASVDAFAANSGSGVFRAVSLDLVGILVRGEADYKLDLSEECLAVNVIDLDDDATKEPGEKLSPVLTTITDLCSHGFSSERLCGKAPVCGNGACEGHERHSSCPVDCTVAPFCGDGVCQIGEACEKDCGTLPPRSWVCEPGYYDGSDGCDLNCGAVDPDCDAAPGCTASDEAGGFGASGFGALLLVLAMLAVRQRRR